jgi:hypothetical protein
MGPALWPVLIAAILAKRPAAANGLNLPTSASRGVGIADTPIPEHERSAGA